MPHELYKDILSIEDSAAKIIESAKKQVIHILSAAKTHSEQIISTASKEAQTEKEALLKQYKESALKEAAEIDKDNANMISTMKLAIAKKIPEAKKLCQ